MDTKTAPAFTSERRFPSLTQGATDGSGVDQVISCWLQGRNAEMRNWRTGDMRELTWTGLCSCRPRSCFFEPMNSCH